MVVSPPAKDENGTARILIVEDEGIIAGHIAARLLKTGYSVAGIAESSEEALASVREVSPDLILMDIRIKGSMDGIQTAAKLRETSDVPIIYLTAHTDQSTVDRAKMTEAFGFLTKPVHPTSLATSIEMAIHKHRADRAERAQRAWMETVLGTMADATVLVDANRRIQYMNGPAETLTGWNNEEARDREIAMILPLRELTTELEANRFLYPPDSPQPPSHIPRGLVASKRTGQWFPVEGEVAPSVSAGKVLGAVITFRDATARRAEENEVRHQFKMQAVGRLAAGIAHDFNNLLLTILGYTDELMGRSLSLRSAQAEGSVVHGNKGAQAEGSVVRGIEGSQAEGSVVRGNKDAQAEGSVVRGIEDAQAEGSVVRGNKDAQAEGSVVRGIESAQAEGSVVRGIEDADIRALEEIRHAGNQAAGLTQQLLKFSRSEPVRKVDINLNNVIRDTEELVRRLGGPSVHWQFLLDEDLKDIRADQGQLKQVVMNLAANARDAMPDGGRVTFETTNVDAPQGASPAIIWKAFVAFSVSDTGAGMSAEMAEHLFEPFFTTKSPGGGTGLGLSIVFSIVTDLGGTIHVDSEKGRGTTFTVYLPVSEPGCAARSADAGNSLEAIVEVT